jgi:uncharacterized protein YegJ (DUF2314 family)
MQQSNTGTKCATHDDSNEWMWVELSVWKGFSMTGLLRNEPDKLPGLHAGATVKVNHADVFDYVLYTADGTEEGNETGDPIEKAAKK